MRWRKGKGGKGKMGEVRGEEDAINNQAQFRRMEESRQQP
jgi:hypothetical protein